MANNYGNKGSVWKWVIIYLIIAAVVYGLIYYFVINKDHGSVSNYGSTSQQNTSSGY